MYIFSNSSGRLQNYLGTPFNRNIHFEEYQIRAKINWTKIRRYHQISQQNIEFMDITDWTSIFWTKPGVFEKSPNSEIN